MHQRVFRLLCSGEMVVYDSPRGGIDGLAVDGLTGWIEPLWVWEHKGWLFRVETAYAKPTLKQNVQWEGQPPIAPGMSQADPGLLGVEYLGIACPRTRPLSPGGQEFQSWCTPALSCLSWTLGWGWGILSSQPVFFILT